MGRASEGQLEQETARVTRRQGGRFGRLAPPPSGGEGAIRCECDHCGAHLLAAAGLHGRLYGVCLVCGGDRFTPVS